MQASSFYSWTMTFFDPHLHWAGPVYWQEVQHISHTHTYIDTSMFEFLGKDTVSSYQVQSIPKEDSQVSCKPLASPTSFISAPWLLMLGRSPHAEAFFNSICRNIFFVPASFPILSSASACVCSEGSVYPQRLHNFSGRSLILWLYRGLYGLVTSHSLASVCWALQQVDSLMFQIQFSSTSNAKM